MQEIKKDWQENKSNINTYLNNTLKTENDNTYNVNVTHPQTKIGCTFGENNIIWGHENGVKDTNYNLTYLVHESLHNFISISKKNKTDYNINHSIIELISDYELYSLLLKKSTYNEGHGITKEYRASIYPYWLQYIGLSEEDIKKRFDFDCVEYKDYEKIDFSNRNIFDF